MSKRRRAKSEERRAKSEGRRAKERSAAGFTLLEIIVALALLGVAVALVMQLISGSLRSVRSLGDHVVAVGHADSIMNNLLVDDTLKQPGELSGEFDDGYRWRAVVNEIIDPPEPGQRQQEIPIKKLQISLVVSWRAGGKENTYRLDTLKLVENERFTMGGGVGIPTPVR